MHATATRLAHAHIKITETACSARAHVGRRPLVGSLQVSPTLGRVAREAPESRCHAPRSPAPLR
jgi:hypothetical protein